MKIVTADVDLDLGACGRIGAHAPHVVSDAAAVAIRRATAAAGLPLRVSGMGHYTRRYGGQDLAGKRLLAWRGCGLGDQLMASAVLRAIGARFPTAQIDFYADPRVHAMLWAGAGELPFRALPEPIPLAAWRAADWHLILEDCCEADAEPDQGHAVDRMLWAAGLEPAEVPAGLKLPVVPVAWEDVDAAARLMGLRAGECLVVWQLASSTPIRSYPPGRTREALAALRARLPQSVRVVCVGRALEQAAYLPLPEGIEAAPPGTRLRTVLGLAAMAGCVVAPDSVLAHAAGGLRRPCVGLWGSFSPAWRAAHYPEHRALCGTRDCAPCGIHECGEQEPGCPAGKRTRPDDPYCAAVAQIAPERIAAAVAAALGLA